MSNTISEANKDFKTAIIGYGVVGKAMKKLFLDALIYDPAYAKISASKKQINSADAAFICVPTPMAKDGSCDTSVVEEIIAWLNTPLIIIRSTISPGTTDRLKKKYPKKRIVFMPEYIGETPAHPMANESKRSFLIFGGDKQDCSCAVEVFQQVYNASVKILCVSAVEAEIIKYMENAAIATMVTLANEFYNICKVFNVPYDMVREGFLMDQRMSRYFTFVYPKDRGFDGKCLPKDLTAIIKAAQKAGYNAEFIKAILENNKRIKGL